MNDVKIFYYEQLDNTINQSKKLIKNNEPAPFAVICDEQLSGVASSPEKSWDSPNAGNIYLTLVYQLREVYDGLAGLSNKILGEISNYLNIKADSGLIYFNRNDIFYNKLKMGGAMLSADLKSMNVSFSIGLNINSTNKDFNIELQDKITTLSDITNKSYDLKEMTKEIIKIIIDS
jgi:biotin-(acetyl-CoA carboxylase) ligase